MPDVSFTIPERTTQRLQFTIKDELGVVIDGASLTTCTLTLYDQATEQVINSRTDVDVKANVSGSGVFAFTFDPADSQLIGSHSRERHVALIEWTYAAGAKRGQYEVELVVVASPKVP